MPSGERPGEKKKNPPASTFKGLSRRNVKSAAQLTVVPAMVSRQNSLDMNLAENESPLTLGCKLSLTSMRRFFFSFVFFLAAEFFDWIKLNFNDAFGGGKWVIAAAMG